MQTIEVPGMTAPPIHHVGYVVNDLRAGAEHFAAAYGAGPFLVMEHLVFDEISYLGDPAVYDHSSGFGQWGPILVELTEVHTAEPSGFRERLVTPGGGIGHVAWLTDSLADEIVRLQRLGATPFHAGRTGPASAVWFDGGPILGHPVEVLERRDEILMFYGMVRAAAEDWDGVEPYRPMSGPPA